MRLGAGRPATRGKTSQYQRLDIRVLARSGRIGANAESAELAYRYTVAEGARDIRQRVAIVYTPQNYGGSRPWFVCPYCGGRCAILYLHGWPKCRRCARLAYPSQSEDAIGRSWRRTRNIERRLGWKDGEPRRKPAWMRWPTFERLQDKLIDEEVLRDDMLAVFAARMLKLMG